MGEDCISTFADDGQTIPTSRHLSIRALRLWVLLLAGLGTAACLLTARFFTPPLIPLGELGPELNLAHIRTGGSVVRGPDYFPAGPALYFTLADAGTELRVAATGHVAQALVADQRFPTVGDWVTVTGVLRPRSGSSMLYLRDPSAVEIHREDPAPLSAGEIVPEMAGRRVVVEGWVRDVRRPHREITLIDLHDQEAGIPIAVSRSLLSLTQALPPLSPGDAVRVTGTVSLYHGQPQVVPASGADVSLSPERLPPAGPSSVTPEDVGRWLLVQGSVLHVFPASRGYRFILGEEGTPATLTLFLREGLWKRLPHSATLDVGAQIRAQGWLRSTDGAWELVPEEVSDLVLLIGAPDTPLVRLEEVGPGWLGRPVCAEGQLVRKDTYPTGMLLQLDGGTASLPVWVPSAIAREVPLSLLTGGAARVCGWIARYRDRLEILPRRESDLRRLLPLWKDRRR
jgi:DNA/RNA endonuclease YhcR with UshA esterase domain